MSRLAGKTAIVTGAASGIGSAIARGFADEGAKVCVADISQEKCDQVASEIGRGAVGIAVNVCDKEAISRLVKTVDNNLGSIDILVNSAGVFGMESVIEVSESEFDRIMAVNIRGLVFMTKAVLCHMLEKNQKGSIVNITSSAGRRASPGACVYSMSKAAVISYTQAAAQEMAPAGIRVNAIAPGATDTAMWREQVTPAFNKVLGPDVPDATTALTSLTPAGRMAESQDYVGAAVYLASDESSFVIGQTLNVDGGYLMN